MKEYFFDTIIEDLEQIGYAFRGKTLSREQFLKVEEIMDNIKASYGPCIYRLDVIDAPESTINQKTAMDILAKSENSVCSFNDIATMCADCAVCSQKKENEKPSPVLIPIIRNVIPKTIWEDMSNQENYNNAMKVVD